MSQDALIYRLVIGHRSCLLREVSGREGLSEAWVLNAKFFLDPHTIVGAPDEFDPDELIKQTAIVVLERGGQEVRRIQGVITEVEQSASISGHSDMEVRIEPRFALLKHRVDIRNHRDMTVPAIVAEIAAAIGVRVDDRLTETYPVRPYSVQWRESDFDYCQRLLEDEGIYSFYTSEDVLVLGDKPEGYDSLAGGTELPFRQAAGTTQNEDAVIELGARACLRPSEVTLRDWNTEHPDLDMDVKAKSVHAAGPEWYDFPGEYATPGEGVRKARLVAEAFDRAAACMHGKSTCGRIYPGVVFALSDAPVGFNDGEHVVRSIEHDWKHEASGFVCGFEADPKELTYRPPRATHVPTILNPLTGVVCTNGEDIQCDAFGRVKIHFPWDRIRPFDDNCSDWVPVIQDNTGGSSAIPRKDWEMVVHFLEGDPDRPVVVGRVYNGEDPPPEDLPEMRDRSKLVSRQSPSREDANMVRFEDRAGHEVIRTMAPMFQNIRVANNQSSKVGRSNTRNIGNDESVRIGVDAEWQVGATSEPFVQNDQTYTVDGNRKHSVGAGDTNAVGGDHTLDVGVNHEQVVFSDISYGSTSLDEIFKSDVLETYKTRYETMIGGPMTVIINGSLTETALHGKSEQTTRDRIETIGAGHTLNSQNEVQLRVDNSRNLNVGASFSAKCTELMTLTGASSFNSCSGSGSYTASADLMLIVSDGPAGEPGTNESWIVLRDGVLELKAMDKVVFDVSGSSSSQSGNSSQI